MTRWTLPLLFALAACDATKPPEVKPPPPPPPKATGPAADATGAAGAGPWLNTADQAPLQKKLAAWKGKKAVLLEFSFLA